MTYQEIWESFLGKWSGNDVEKKKGYLLWFEEVRVIHMVIFRIFTRDI